MQTMYLRRKTVGGNGGVNPPVPFYINLNIARSGRWAKIPQTTGLTHPIGDARLMAELIPNLTRTSFRQSGPEEQNSLAILGYEEDRCSSVHKLIPRWRFIHEDNANRIKNTQIIKTQV